MPTNKYHNMRNYLAIFAGLSLTINPSYAGDYAVASCKTWNGTITQARNQNTSKAEMTGVVSDGDIMEYCMRSSAPQNYTKCLNETRITTKTSELYTVANCQDSTMIFYYKDARNQYVTRANFKTKPADLSCSSGLTPLISQFKYLCLNSYNSNNMASW